MLAEQSVSAWNKAYRPCSRPVVGLSALDDPGPPKRASRQPYGSCGFTEVFGEILLPPFFWDKGLAGCGPNFVLCRPFAYRCPNLRVQLGCTRRSQPLKICRYSSSVKHQGPTIIGSNRKSCLRTFRQGVFDNLLDLSDSSLVARTFISAILEPWTRDSLRHSLADTALASQPTTEDLP